jgi:hypothetical protein
MSLKGLRILLWSLPVCSVLNVFNSILIGQPACLISGGTDYICPGSSTVWVAEEGALEYLWTGPGGFSSAEREITVSLGGDYTLFISDVGGTSSCQRHLYIYNGLDPGAINTTTRQFCAGGTAAIGGTSSPYGPATGGSGSYAYTWQLQAGCSGQWTDIPGTNSTSYTPEPPSETTCFRRKVNDLICVTEAYTESKRFEIFPDPVSQDIVPQPSGGTVCAGIPVSAIFTGGSGGFPGGTTDVYEYSTNGGSTWSAYLPGQEIPTAGLSGTDTVRIRTRRISTGVNGCNYGSFITTSWSVNPSPSTSPILHR